jgi:hypothetical protein
MTVRRKDLAGVNNAWRICIYISPKNNYEEVFYGTEADATKREGELRRQKARGELFTSIRRTRPRYDVGPSDRVAWENREKADHNGAYPPDGE